MVKKSDDKKGSENRIAYIPVCRECSVMLTDENWYPSDKKGHSYICKKCSFEKNKIWQQNNRDRYIQSMKKWYQNNRDRYDQSQREYRHRLINDVINGYGGKCACCDETRKEYLSIDHIDGNGNKQRREIGVSSSREFYCWLRQNNYPEGFQVLCFNCNMGKGNYSVSPHNKEVFEKEFEAKLEESYNSRYNWALKLDIIENYGNKCALCGEDNPHCLTIDHINGRSLEDNLTGIALYLKLKNENYPKDNYRLLCYNCNCALGFNRITEEKILQQNKHLKEKRKNGK